MSQTVNKDYPFINCKICRALWPYSALTKEGICPDCLVIERGDDFDEL